MVNKDIDAMCAEIFNTFEETINAEVENIYKEELSNGLLNNCSYEKIEINTINRVEKEIVSVIRESNFSGDKVKEVSKLHAFIMKKVVQWIEELEKELLC